MLADRILSFLKQLEINVKLPEDVEVMNPYKDHTAITLCEQFYRKYYSDDQPRRIILGINPGRFGGGLTGIPFTDPIKLAEACSIPNNLPRKAELSADFIYRMISAYGSPDLFYARYFFGALSPLGFTRSNKNLNYYDVRELQQTVSAFIVDSMNGQINIGIDTTKAFCLGEGQNFKFLKRLNDEHGFFKEIIPLPHPRFIMQYRRKQLQEFIDRYLEQLQ